MAKIDFTWLVLLMFSGIIGHRIILELEKRNMFGFNANVAK